MADWPSLQELRYFLRLQVDQREDAVLGSALSAAIDYGDRNTDRQWPPGDPTAAGQVPEVAHQACLMHAARLYKRRDTVDGTIGWGDVGVVRVGRADPDIDALYSVIVGSFNFG